MMKEKMKKRLWAMAMGIGIFAGGLWGLGKAGKVQAAELPEITELQVVAADEGGYIAAQCEYENYEKESGLMMILYLYQVKEESQSIIASYQLVPYGETGRCSTDFIPAVEGLYQASVGIDCGGVFKQINSEHYYRVIQAGDQTEVVEVMEPEQEESKGEEYVNDGEQEKSRGEEYVIDEEQEKSAGRCAHNPDYELVQAATPKSDGILAYQCTWCGEVFDYVEVPNSAYEAFLQEAAAAVRNTQTDEVFIRTDRWMSFHSFVLEAISERPEVTVVIQYWYQGKWYEVKIPAGADVSLLADENGFCGFQYLAQVFDETLFSV